jgi:tetratricopeptide (TPR) repeat protein
MLFCGAVVCGPALADDQCSLELLETSAARAVEACTSVLNRDNVATTSRVEALKIRGRAMQRLDRYDYAIADYEAGLQLAPDDAELHLRRGWTAYEELRRGWMDAGGFLDPALHHTFELVLDQAHQALKVRPGYADAYSLIAAALQIGAPKDFAGAKAMYDQAIRLEPTDPRFRSGLLILLKENGYIREAIEEADAILQLPAESTTKPLTTEFSRRRTTVRIATSMKRAQLLLVVGQTNEARQAYDRAIAVDPDAITFAARAAFKLSQLSFFPGMPPPPLDVIQDDLDKALALDPDYWVSHQQQAQLHFVREQYDLAATEFAYAVKQFPSNGRVRWQYATMLRKLGRGEEAATEATTAFRLDPGFMFNQLGMLRKRGYLADIAPDADPRPALMDAARACMLDERCG